MAQAGRATIEPGTSMRSVIAIPRRQTVASFVSALLLLATVMAHCHAASTVASTDVNPSASESSGTNSTAQQDGPLLTVGLVRTVGTASSLAVAANGGIIVSGGDVTSLPFKEGTGAGTGSVIERSP